LVRAQQGINAARARGGVLGRIAMGAWAVRGALTFARLYLMPVKRHTLPDAVRLSPTW
jgi:magnesium-protoporphyrin IX monomethyl ester (oxidative) cyclase